MPHRNTVLLSPFGSRSVQWSQRRESMYETQLGYQKKVAPNPDNHTNPGGPETRHCAIACQHQNLARASFPKVDPASTTNLFSFVQREKIQILQILVV